VRPETNNALPAMLSYVSRPDVHPSYRTFCKPTYPRVVRRCALVSPLSYPLFEWGPDPGTRKAKAEVGARARAPAICMYQNHRLQRSSTTVPYVVYVRDPRRDDTYSASGAAGKLPTLFLLTSTCFTYEVRSGSIAENNSSL